MIADQSPPNLPQTIAFSTPAMSSKDIENSQKITRLGQKFFSLAFLRSKVTEDKRREWLSKLDDILVRKLILHDNIIAS
jgi:hypothetical protein